MLYCSATSATDVASMGNLSRLHLWGANLPFDSAPEFARALGRGGVGASEILAMELKSRGLLVARSLSFDGTSFDTVACPLSHEQRRTYDAACALWADLLESTHQRKAQEDSEPSVDGVRRKRYAMIFWGEHLRFFQQLLLSAKIDAAAERVRTALAAGMGRNKGRGRAWYLPRWRLRCVPSRRRRTPQTRAAYARRPLSWGCRRRQCRLWSMRLAAAAPWQSYARVACGVFCPYKCIFLSLPNSTPRATQRRRDSLNLYPYLSRTLYL